MSSSAWSRSGGEGARVVSSMCEPDGSKDGVEAEKARVDGGVRDGGVGVWSDGSF